MKNALRPVLIAAALLAAWSAAPAQDLALLVRHVETSSGRDGVARTIEFSERFYRSDATVWIERVLPVPARAAQRPHEHAGGKAAKHRRHLDTATATRWIARGDDELGGRPRLRLVSAQDAVVVAVDRTDWRNVGFDGSWNAAWHLLDPALLDRMKVVKRGGDTTTFAMEDAENGSLTVVWNRRFNHPQSVTSVSPDGSMRRRTTTRRLPQPAKLPWTATGSFETRDYADHLD